MKGKVGIREERRVDLFEGSFTSSLKAWNRHDGDVIAAAPSARRTRSARCAPSRNPTSSRRYSSPSSGRFINRDPIEEQGGINLYSFVGNNSVNAYDYLGMDAFMTTYMTNSGGTIWIEGDCIVCFSDVCACMNLLMSYGCMLHRLIWFAVH